MRRILAIVIALASATASASGTVTDSKGRIHGLGLLKGPPHHGKLYFNPSAVQTGEIPEEYDLRALGFVSDVKDQGQCGSCWAHAIVESLEDAILHSGAAKVTLAPQELVDCDSTAYGCSGGMMDNANWIVKNGTAHESAYPYHARDQRCKRPLPIPQIKAKSWAYVGAPGRAPTTEELKRAVLTYGSLFVTVAAGGADWDGRAELKLCRNRGTNHMVEIVGWRKDGKWIMRNSWGTGWGDKGFAYMPAKCDMIANEADSAGYTVFADAPCIPPTIQLPSQIDIPAGIEFPIGVRSQVGVTYSWEVDGVKIPGAESMIYVKPAKDTVYKVTASNACGTGESTVQVHILPSITGE